MSKVTIDEKRLLTDLQNFIRINSINPSLDSDYPGEEEISSFLGNLLRDMGLDVKIQDLGNRRANVIATLHGSGGGKNLLFNGHIDTVDVKGMTIDPFDPVFRDGKVYGRGSLDMKGGIASILGAVRALVESGATLKGDVILTFVADEEYVSIGTEALIGNVRADGAIICEPTDLSLILAHKGFTWERLNFHGRAAHGSRPDEGVDAIMKAGKFLAAIERMDKEILSTKKHPILGSPSIHASLINGGIGISTYPDSCVLELERRTLPGETADSVKEEIRSILDELGDEVPELKTGYEQYFARNPLEIGENEPIVTCLKEAYEKIMGNSVTIGGFSGWTDAAILNDAGIPAINFGPVGMGLHAAEEYVEFQSLVDCAMILTRTAQVFCGS